VIRTLLRLVVLVAVASTAGIWTPITAEASPPTVTVEPYELVEVIAPGEPLIFGTNPCPFAITIHHQGTFVTTTFFDADGTPIRLLGRSKAFTETYSANGRSVSTKSVASVRIEATNDEVTITGRGSSRHLHVPGVGLLLAQAGRFVIDPETGVVISFSGLNIPAGSEFCAALSP
jgi:hypothetical protein